MVAHDYYEVLGVSRDVSPEELKRRYRQLARQFHPDVNKDDGAAERFKEINEAYSILSDPEKRSRYDHFGREAFQGYTPPSDLFEDLLSNLFGFTTAERASAQGQDGEDLLAQLDIDLLDSALGRTVEIDVERLEVCPDCQGSRAKAGTQPQRCSTCSGRGEVRYQQQSFFGTLVTRRPCPACHGQGQMIAQPCPACRGQGRVKTSQAVSVGLPPGIDTGHRLRIPGEGNAGLGGRPGDLYVDIRLKPHPQLQRSGDDLIYPLSASMVQAALGTPVTIPTLKGEEAFILPPGTQPGSEFRLKGKGMPRLRGRGQGDLVVRVQVVVPKKLSSRAQKLLQELAQELGEGNNQGKAEGLKEKIKGALGLE
ncbi:MAG: molecular chaperone DnaJ [Deinococcus sp.]|nr:molecular chaperone DnaJ [Deinococcus sp.]